MRATLSRYRRLLAALFAAASAALGLTATRPHEAGVRVLVASHDLPDGHMLTEGDVTTQVLPARAVPPMTVPTASAEKTRGRTLAGPMSRGEPLTTARLRAPGLGRATDPAAVAVPIRLADGEVTRLLHVGERVDVLAARSEDPTPARVVASTVPIVAIPAAPEDADEGALIVIQTTHTQATTLARAAVDSRLSVTILPP